ncbi:hypothetical protein [Fluviicola taffensis]|uniref:Uncharacterized protein n=1 Tax=Fluviicola taffensis (strain DSM 16823 / NCIMB 13979 / RW262) TaxID=755732 RepID=F2IHH2_FLUTR|nr:hypothetical protein [Fluviicola taffensis]AEA43737.1 hypothetical protein Fluta_1746 [Fluviicola taffensis DSM 16823]
MTLRISIAIFALSFLFGTSGSANAAEQLSNQSKSVLEMKASTNTKKEFKPKKRKKSKVRKHRGCEAYGG